MRLVLEHAATYLFMYAWSELNNYSTRGTAAPNVAQLEHAIAAPESKVGTFFHVADGYCLVRVSCDGSRIFYLTCASVDAGSVTSDTLQRSHESTL